MSDGRRRFCDNVDLFAFKNQIVRTLGPGMHASGSPILSGAIEEEDDDATSRGQCAERSSRGTGIKFLRRLLQTGISVLLLFLRLLIATIPRRPSILSYYYSPPSIHTVTADPSTVSSLTRETMKRETP